VPDTWRRGYAKRKKHNCEERQPSYLRGECNIKAIWMGLIKLGVMVAAAAGAYGLTVSAGDRPGGVSRLAVDAVALEHGSDLSEVSAGYERVEIPEAGLTLAVPFGWQQLDEEPAWSPTGDGEERIGVSWCHILSAVKPEAALLPDDGLVVSSVPIALGWGTGWQYVLANYSSGVAGPDSGAPASSIEIHTIVAMVDGETQLAYDLHAIAPTEDLLAALKPVLDGMLGSIHLTTHHFP
jgi:hypothetical protein